MASKSSSGLSKEQREKFMRDHGFVLLRSGKGSHQQWEHPKLKGLAKTHKIKPPANLLSNIAQKPWEQTVCTDPGGRSWHTIEKHAEWCRKTAAEFAAKAERERQCSEIRGQFRDAIKEICKWRKTLKAHFKAGLKRESAPGPSIKWREFLALKEKKNQLSKPSR